MLSRLRRGRQPEVAAGAFSVEPPESDVPVPFDSEVEPELEESLVPLSDDPESDAGLVVEPVSPPRSLAEEP